MPVPQINDAVGDAEEEGVAIPMVTGIGDWGFRPRLEEHRVEAVAVLALDGEARLPPPLVEIVDTEGIAIALASRLLGQAADLFGLVTSATSDRPT